MKPNPRWQEIAKTDPADIAEKHYRKRPIDMLRQWHSRVETWTLHEAGIIEAQGAATTGTNRNLRIMTT